MCTIRQIRFKPLKDSISNSEVSMETVNKDRMINCVKFIGNMFPLQFRLHTYNPKFVLYETSSFRNSKCIPSGGCIADCLIF